MNMFIYCTVSIQVFVSTYCTVFCVLTVYKYLLTMLYCIQYKCISNPHVVCPHTHSMISVVYNSAVHLWYGMYLCAVQHSTRVQLLELYYCTAYGRSFKANTVKTKYWLVSW